MTTFGVILVIAEKVPYILRINSSPEVFKEWARNNFPIWHLIFSPSAPVLQSQKLEMEAPFLRFCSIRTNEYELNLSAKSGSYYVPIPDVGVSRKVWVLAESRFQTICCLKIRSPIYHITGILPLQGCKLLIFIDVKECCSSLKHIRIMLLL